jgi:hypothetical protein
VILALLFDSVIDSLLESVREGLEENDFRKHQTRLMAVTFLAELYNYNLLSTQTIMDLLYMVRMILAFTAFANECVQFCF